MKKGSKKRGKSHSKGHSKIKVTKIIHESTKEIKIERALVENFIALQKVMVNLSTKFDNLSSQISKLLELFEISAKSLAQKDFESTEKTSRETKVIIEKLDTLAQQAGLIGKGLVLIHESSSEKHYPERSIPINPPVKPMGQATQITRPSIPPNKPPSTNDYQKSTLSRVSETNE